LLDLERPFHRLVHHFVTRIFHGAGDGDDLQFSIPALLGLLSAPSAFGAILLLNKYSTLRQFLMGIRDFDIYRAIIPDEYSFIVYSMVVTGAVVILKWDRLFPDRQDYDNLATLPLSTRQHFMASLIALLFLAALFAAVINGAASVIFPTAVTARFRTFWPFLELFTAHSAAVVLASFFACFALLLLMGVTLLITPKRYIRAVSLGVRILCALGLVGILSTVFTLPRLLGSGEVPWYAFLVPPVWFLDLNQMLLAEGRQQLGAGVLCLEITAITVVLSLVIYAVTYYREYIQIPERGGGLDFGGGRDSYSLVRRIWDAAALRSSFEVATYHFAVKTLFRSEKHCLLFGTAAAIGFFMAAQTLSGALAAPPPNSVGGPIDERLLSVSLIMAYCTIVSLRAVFDLPSDRKANWIFRAILDLNRHDGRSVAVKVMLSVVASWLIVIGLPLHVVLWGWTTALLHTAYVLMSSLVLAELLLIRFQKIPFTCTYTASRDKVLVRIVLGFSGLVAFTELNSGLEASLLQNPIRFAAYSWFYMMAVWFIRVYRAGLPPAERVLIFEDRPLPVVQLLNISK
jgi:hypothetical protein